MSVSTDLISQFAKITNDQKVSRIDEITLYGEVVEYEDRICVKFDGSNEITPVTTISDVDEDGNSTNYRYGSASVKAGDRVSVRLKNHSATITGNLSDPSMGKAEFTVEEDYILAQVESVSLKVTNLGVEFKGLADGTTIIDGGCIKTGTIDAARINLTGAICYQYSEDGMSDWHDEQTDDDFYRRESFDGGETWGDAYKFVAKDGKDGSSARVPSYIKSTCIDFSKIETPTLIANYVQTLGQFQVGYGSEDSFEPIGYMGAATGLGVFDIDDPGTTTYGIAIGTTSERITASTIGQYIIVTNAGVRMTYNDGENKHSLYVTASGAWVDHGSGAIAVDGEHAVFA